MKSYLLFTEGPPLAKTKQFWVTNLDKTVELGYIRWYSHWRKYCFYPSDSTVFDTKCLTEISNFLDNLMKQRSL